MASRKPFSVRKPKLRLTKKGLKLSPGSMRIGGRSGGINISKSGISGSARTPLGTYNTKRGASMRCLPMLCLLFLGMLSPFIVASVWLLHS